MYSSDRHGPLTRLAAEVEDAVRRRRTRGERGGTAGTTLARGEGWVVEDVLCTSGPDDRPFEERHVGVSIAVVVSGTFQYRTANGRVLLTPGALLLGNDGQCFECAHDHAAGDRCVAFHYAPEYFERIAFEAGSRGKAREFGVGRIPPLREVSQLGARTAAGVLAAGEAAWDELAVTLAATAVRLGSGAGGRPKPSNSGAESRVSASVRSITRDPATRRPLAELAHEARLSPYHYLRTFERVTGVTPHQFILRMRLREAAARLATDRPRVLAVALDAGFNDLSHFNRMFRREFGLSPREFRGRRFG